MIIPLVFLLVAAQPGTNDDKNKDGTIPYKFNLPGILVPVPVPNGNPITQEGVALGRRLFYDSILSGNQKQSCSSCHRQELAFSDGREIATGSEGQKARRNSISLVNLGYSNNFFWDGRTSSMEDLVHFPIADKFEMNGDTVEIVRKLNKDENYRTLFEQAFGAGPINMTAVANAISQFLRTIVSVNAPMDSIYRDYYRVVKKEVEHHPRNIGDVGLLYEAFDQENGNKYGYDSSLLTMIKQVSPSKHVLNVFAVCISCHYNSLQVFCLRCDTIQYKNNGLTEGTDMGLYEITGKEEDKYKFKVPTLRNLVFTAPYMHDGRFKTLEEVVEHYNSGLQANKTLDALLKDCGQPIRFYLDNDEKKQLIGLLKLLTDSSIVTDARFSAPVKP